MISDKKKLRFLLISAAVVLVSLLYFFIDARGTNIFPKCPFHTLTGLLCPGCGSQRAISALLHLDLASALRHNLLLVAAIPIMIYSAYAAVMNTFTGVYVRQKLFYSVTFIKSVGLIILVYWIVRNLPFHPFTLLAPPH